MQKFKAKKIEGGIQFDPPPPPSRLLGLKGDIRNEANCLLKKNLFMITFIGTALFPADLGGTGGGAIEIMASGKITIDKGKFLAVFMSVAFC